MVGKREVQREIAKAFEGAVTGLLGKVQEHQHVQNAKVQAGFDEFEERLDDLEERIKTLEENEEGRSQDLHVEHALAISDHDRRINNLENQEGHY